MNPTSNPETIKQARQLILRHLDIVYPSGLMMKYLYQTVCTVNRSYDYSLMAKDVMYLEGKGYVEFITIGGKQPNIDEHTVVKLTVKGKEIAEGTMDDPALEI